MLDHTVRISLRDADAAGVLFFGRYFALAHDAYETFLDGHGLNLGRLLQEGRFVVPVVHAESDYRRPLRVGERVTIRLRVAEVRRRAFTVAYEFLDGSGESACSLRTVHVAVDLSTGRAAPLPDELRAVLEAAHAAAAAESCG